MKYIPHFVFHSSVDGHSFFKNNVAINIGVQISIQVPVLNYFGYTIRGGIAKLYGPSMFNLL